MVEASSVVFGLVHLLQKGGDENSSRKETYQDEAHVK
jgi:hypothetical protein